jgi:hypothetical protein
MFIKTAYNRSDTVRYDQIRSDTVGHGRIRLRLRYGYGMATVRLRVLARIGRITVILIVKLICDDDVTVISSSQKQNVNHNSFHDINEKTF